MTETEGMEVVVLKMDKKEARALTGLLAIARGAITGPAEGRELMEAEQEFLTVARELSERIDKELGSGGGDPFFPHKLI